MAPVLKLSRHRGVSVAIIAMIAIVLVVVGSTALYLKLTKAVPPSAAGVHVTIPSGASTNQSLGYSPSNITVVIGINNTVYWTNEDSGVHTVTAVGGTFDSGDLNPGNTFAWTFTTPGTYPYHCTIHTWMTGTVVVKS
jgi:plastocyanin